MMTRQTAKRHAIVSSAIVVLGIITVIVTTALAYPKTGFWAGYVDGFKGTGYMAILLGATWCGLACLNLFTDFFNINRSLQADKFALMISIIIGATVLLMAIVIPNVNLYKEKQFSKNAKQKAEQTKHHDNLKLLVAAGLLAGGAIIGSVPTRRFFKRA